MENHQTPKAVKVSKARKTKSLLYRQPSSKTTGHLIQGGRKREEELVKTERNLQKWQPALLSLLVRSEA